MLSSHLFSMGKLNFYLMKFCVMIWHKLGVYACTYLSLFVSLFFSIHSWSDIKREKRHMSDDVNQIFVFNSQTLISEMWINGKKRFVKLLVFLALRMSLIWLSSMEMVVWDVINLCKFGMGLLKNFIVAYIREDYQRKVHRDINSSWDWNFSVSF